MFGDTAGEKSKECRKIEHKNKKAEVIQTVFFYALIREWNLIKINHVRGLQNATETILFLSSVKECC